MEREWSGFRACVRSDEVAFNGLDPVRLAERYAHVREDGDFV